MKKQLTLLVLVLLSIPCFSIIKTIEKGKQYKVVKPMGLGNSITFYHILQCDTTIQNKDYIKLFESDSSGNLLSYLGCLREDTLLEKIYFVPKDSINERVLIDYNLNVGDSFTFSSSSSFVGTVDSIKFINIFGATRKVIYFGPVLSFIEGVGCSFFGLNSNYLNNGLDAFGYISSLNMLPENCFPLFNQNIIDNQTIEIYPNPTSQNIFINLNNIDIEKLKFSVFDMNGKKVNANFYPFNNQTYSFDASKLPIGNYFIKIENNNQLIGQKIVSKIK